MEIHPLTPDRLEDLADLFRTNSVTRGCWCMFFLVSTREMGWGAENRARFEELAVAQDPCAHPHRSQPAAQEPCAHPHRSDPAAQDPGARPHRSQPAAQEPEHRSRPGGAVPLGLLAYRDQEPVGWCAMGPRSRYPRAMRSPILKERDRSEDDQVWLVPCFYIRRDARRTGLTRRLLDAAVAEAQRYGATAVEGFPLAADNRRPPAEAFYGGELAFAACGFTPVTRPNPRRVVMRRTLR